MRTLESGLPASDNGKSNKQLVITFESSDTVRVDEACVGYMTKSSDSEMFPFSSFKENCLHKCVQHAKQSSVARVLKSALIDFIN
jgi:hypothetical protein